MKYQLSDEEICNLYKKGLSSIKIAVQAGVSKPTILKILKKYNVERRSLSDAQRRYTLDTDAFNILDEKSEYWLGFLMADGYVQFTRYRSNIVLSLQIRDKDHLNKYAEYLKTNKPLYFFKQNGHQYARMSISSKKIIKRLATYGIIQRKSKITEAKLGLNHSRHFWRGVVDGDGCINITGLCPPRLRLVGSKPLMNQYLAYIKKYIVTGSNVNPFWKNKDGKRCIAAYYVDIVGNQAYKIIQLLYKNNSISLDRKNNLSEKIIKEIKYEKQN